MEQIKREEEEHSKELERLYLEQNRKKDKQISPIYNSSVCLLIKNENQYLKEWLDHYLSVGLDHIFIYDNNSDIPVKSIVKEWYSNEILEKITVIDYLGSHNDLQTESYNDFLKNYGMQTRWVLFADSDEFVQFPNGNKVNEFFLYNPDMTYLYTGENNIQEYNG